MSHSEYRIPTTSIQHVTLEYSRIKLYWSIQSIYSHNTNNHYTNNHNTNNHYTNNHYTNNHYTNNHYTNNRYTNNRTMYAIYTM